MVGSLTGAVSSQSVTEEFVHAARTDGRTVFLTSHALADVDELCDQMAVLHQGELRFSGTPAQLRSRYGAETLEQAYLACIEMPNSHVSL